VIAGGHAAIGARDALPLKGWLRIGAHDLAVERPGHLGDAGRRTTAAGLPHGEVEEQAAAGEQPTVGVAGDHLRAVGQRERVLGGAARRVERAVGRLGAGRGGARRRERREAEGEDEHGPEAGHAPSTIA
jgi:hypothetical protein